MGHLNGGGEIESGIRVVVYELTPYCGQIVSVFCWFAAKQSKNKSDYVKITLGFFQENRYNTSMILI